MVEVFIADVGGTRCRFAIVENGVLKAKKELESESVINFEKVVSNYLSELKKKPRIALIAGAGPVLKDRIVLTNNAINIEKKSLMKICGFEKVFLYNDLFASSIGALNSKKNKMLNKGKREKSFPSLIIGVGTGLGKALAIPFDKEYKIISSESGHGDFPAVNEDDLELTEFFKEEYNLGDIYWEDILSGTGLARLYDFLQKKSFQEAQSMPSPARIAELLELNDKCAVATFQLFSKYLGRCVRNLALDSLPRGGIYLCGGVLSKNPQIFGDIFLNSFLRHKRFSNFLSGIDIHLVREEDIGLRGLAKLCEKEF